MFISMTPVAVVCTEKVRLRDFTLGVASDTLMLNKLSPNPFFIYHFFGDACALEKMLSAGIIIDRFGACKHSFQLRHVQRAGPDPFLECSNPPLRLLVMVLCNVRNTMVQERIAKSLDCGVQILLRRLATSATARATPLRRAP